MRANITYSSHNFFWYAYTRAADEALKITARARVMNSARYMGKLKIHDFHVHKLSVSSDVYTLCLHLCSLLTLEYYI